MSYRVFARKYRPQTFEEVVGQEHITRTLQNAITQDRLAQAYLLVGPRGIGKTSTARILAKALNCEKGPTPTPCCKCSACLEIAEGNNMDVVEIDGASNNGVDHIRNLRDSAQYSPVRGPYKIFLIDEVHMLTTGAFNALLKILEEPPAHVKFIFATTEAQKVLATILSRCQRFDLRRIPDELIAKHLQLIAGKEDVILEPAAAQAIARGADGGLRDAESMFDQIISFCGQKIQASDVLDVFGFTAQEVIHDLCGHILRCEETGALAIIESQDHAGKDLSRLLDHLITYLRDVLIMQVTGAGEPSAKEHAALVSREKLLELLEHFAASEVQLRWASDKRMQVDVAVIKAAHLIEQASLSEVIETIASLRDGTPLPQPTIPARRIPTAIVAPSPTIQAHEKAAVSPVLDEAPHTASAETTPPPIPSEVNIQTKTSLFPLTAEPVISMPPDAPASSAAEQIWVAVVNRLSAVSPFSFCWLETGRFQVASGDRLIIEFPESQRGCAESMMWAAPQKQLDAELSKDFGHPIKMHPEFLADSTFQDSPPWDTAPAVAAPPAKRAEETSTESLRPAFSSDREEPPPSTTKEEKEPVDAQAEKLAEFKNDADIRKALDIFEGEYYLEKNS